MPVYLKLPRPDFGHEEFLIIRRFDGTFEREFSVLNNLVINTGMQHMLNMLPVIPGLVIADANRNKLIMPLYNMLKLTPIGGLAKISRHIKECWYVGECGMKTDKCKKPGSAPSCFSTGDEYQHVVFCILEAWKDNKYVVIVDY